MLSPRPTTTLGVAEEERRLMISSTDWVLPRTRTRNARKEPKEYGATARLCGGERRGMNV